ncbi:MAG: universal stress protein [Gemmatimonadetes bacterium]|nr:universal stress protein [Gemmatimonadota bacterium]NNF14196.1 universal stress protein [Gemmatimonadota bacterium]NNL30806.1 universal stress protein [Gemmatimonadota bacterium]
MTQNVNHVPTSASLEGLGPRGALRLEHFMYNKIMVPLDGSTFSEGALPMAMRLAERTGAGLHVVTVFEPVSSFTSSNWEAATRRWGELYLGNIEGRLRGAIPGGLTTALLQGSPSQALTDEARRAGADLTVMATHGRGTVARAWLGSVADEFSRTHHGPVLLIRPGESGESLLTERADILIPLDGSDLSEEALDHAVALGERCDSTFHLTRVVPRPPVLTSPYLVEAVGGAEEMLDDARENAADYLEAHADRLRRRGLQVTVSVVADQQPAKAILSEASAVGTDFIVMATHGYRGIQRALLGSTTDKVLRASDIPLLLYRPPDQTHRAAS